MYLTQQQEVFRLLRAMEDLRGGFYVKVALEARQLAMRIMTPSIDSRKTAIHKMLLEVVEEWSRSNDTEVVKGYRSFGHHLAPLVQSVISLFEEVSSFQFQDKKIKWNREAAGAVGADGGQAAGGCRRGGSGDGEPAARRRPRRRLNECSYGRHLM